MPKKNKNKVTLDAFENGDETKKQPLEWSELNLLKDETVKNIMGQQLLLLELTKNHSDVVEKNKELMSAINGLMNAYKDIASETKDIIDSHIGKTGPAVGDEYYEYLQLAGGYIALQESIANLASTGFIDVFAQLKTAPEDAIKALKQVHSDGINELKNIYKGAPNAAK